MGDAKNKEVAARYFEEYWNRANAGVVDELCTSDVHTFAPLVGDFNGREEVKGIIGILHDAIEGFHFEATRPLVAEGDTVVCCWNAVGTVRKAIGYFPGKGEKLSFTGVSIYTMRDGLIAEEINEEDGMKALVQAGVLTL